ncbi:hypothetical protein Tco_0017045 [Tanacetum coccineum]
MGYEKLSQKLTFYKAFFSPQWKFLIHTILQCLSAKTTAWNEFSSTMASATIYLATNQKFNFSKYIFESMVKNLENVSGKFLMYPRFVQVFLDKQLEGMSSHKRIYVIPSHTKKIFRNMRRVGKGFSGRETPLFPTMKQKPKRSTRKETKEPQPSGPTDNVADEAVYKERDDSLVRAATTASSLEAKQDSGNINKIRSKATPNELSSPGTSSGGVNTPRSDEDSLKLKELMELCTNLQQRVLDLENTKTAQAYEITSLKLRVKKLEKKGGSRTHKLKRLFKVGRSARIVSSDEASLGDQEDASKQGRNINDIDKDAEITLVDETQGRYGDDIMFDVSDLAGEEIFVAEQGVPDSKKCDVAQVSTDTVIITPKEIKLAQALQELRTTKPKVKGIIFNEQVESTTTTTTTTRISSQQPSQTIVQDKGKGKMIEPEPVKKFSKKDQLKLDEEVAQRLQAREQEELTIEERAKLFQQLLEKRRKFFAAKRVEEKRNRPPTRAQQRSIMSTYLKNMDRYKQNQLKNKNFSEIQKLFDKAMKRVNTFVDMDTELVKGSKVRAEGSETRAEGSSKRAGDDLEQESTKKQKMDDDKEIAKLQSQMQVIPDEEEVAIDAIPLATKLPNYLIGLEDTYRRKENYY